MVWVDRVEKSRFEIPNRCCAPSNSTCASRARRRRLLGEQIALLVRPISIRTADLPLRRALSAIHDGHKALIAEGLAPGRPSVRRGARHADRREEPVHIRVGARAHRACDARVRGPLIVMRLPET